MLSWFWGNIANNSLASAIHVLLLLDGCHCIAEVYIRSQNNEHLLTGSPYDPGGRGLRQSLTPQAQRALIRSGSKRAEALETLTQQVTELQATLQAERGSKEVSAARVRQVEEELSSAQNSLKAERLLLQKVWLLHGPINCFKILKTLC